MFGEIAVVANHERKSQELKLKKEEKWQCLWDMKRIILVMSTDPSTSKLNMLY